jgi:hypothetical protein
MEALRVAVRHRQGFLFLPHSKIGRVERFSTDHFLTRAALAAAPGEPTPGALTIPADRAGLMEPSVKAA